MATVTLQIISKDEINDIDRIILKYREFFNEVHFAIDDEKVFKDCLAAYHQLQPEIKFFKYEWQNDFAHKRNWLADKCKTDYYFVIDSDDTIVNPEYIKEVVKEAEDNKYTIVYGFYIYSTDQDGNPNAAHWKERLIKNTKKLVWNKKIHENIIATGDLQHYFKLDDRLLVKHNKDYEAIVESQKRNLGYLIEEFKKDGDKTDPRTIAYLGRVLFGLGDFKRARYFLEKHIELSGWDEDRHLSWCQLADLHRLQGDFTQAIACAFEALEEKPEFPDAYLALHNIYFDQEQWTKAVEWGEQGLKKEPPKNFIVLDPSSYTWRPALSLSYCFYNLGEFERAKKLFDYAKKLAPTISFVKEYEKAYQDGLDHSDYIDRLLWMVAFLKDKGEDRLKDLAKSIPKELFENRTVALLRNRFLEPFKWGDKSVVIYCGDTSESWSPKSVVSGIGGSEEAVIYLSRELVKLGYEVVVYNTSGSDEGNYDGVEYRNTVRFNPKDKFNILISWRCNIFKFEVQASRKIIWIHDLPHLDFNEDTLKTFDKIVVLSKYHASLLPANVPDDKVFVSTNGVNPEDFLGLGDIPRQPRRLIWASSYDRGLEIILTNWKEIRIACPNLEIHCYYGFNTYDNYVKRGLIEDKGWKAKMLELFKQEGVFEHGRIGHKELLKEYAKSSIFAYPCTYAGEINCIALTKAIACGCYPLTNDFAVLPERNTHGRIVTNDKFISSLIAFLRHGDTKINNDGYIEANSWKKVAEDWHERLFPNAIETIVEDRFHWAWKQLDPQKTIIDIGCNKGHIFEGWDRSKITSVDLDVYDLPNFVRANADDLPFEDNKFDYACLFEIVEHAENPVKVLSEARRVAKTTIITVPYEYEWGSGLKPFNTIEKEMSDRGIDNVVDMVKVDNPAKEFYLEDGGKHLYHQTYYTPELFTDHLKQAGFGEFKIYKLRYGKWVWLGAICLK